MRHAALAFFAGMFILCFCAASASAATLWFNGDEAWGLGQSNEIGTQVPYSIVYDDFFVPVSDGAWTVNSVWSYDYSSYNGSDRPVTAQARWEIRSGVSAGNGGTLLAGGVSAATEAYSSTSPGTAANDSYKILVDGLDVVLAPGHYWLSVTPIGFGTSYGQFFLQGTQGDNSVGSVAANDGNAFWYTTSFGGQNFVPLSTGKDFSMGLAGVVGGVTTPEPASLFLLSLGMAGLARIRRKR